MQLEAAMRRVTQLESLLPICMFLRSASADGELWSPLEVLPASSRGPFAVSQWMLSSLSSARGGDAGDLNQTGNRFRRPTTSAPAAQVGRRRVLRDLRARLSISRRRAAHNTGSADAGRHARLPRIDAPCRRHRRRDVAHRASDRNAHVLDTAQSLRWPCSLRIAA